MATIAENLHRCEYEARFDEEAFPPFDRNLILGGRPVELPQDYFEFLTLFPMAGEFSALVSCRGLEPCEFASEGLYPVARLFARSSYRYLDLISQNDDTEKRPQDVLIIGDNLFGDPLCMSLNEETFGYIYFVDHEASWPETPPLVARSFSEFLDNLEVEPDD